MKDIKLYIGPVVYPNTKIPWIPTIDSVKATQIYLKNKFLYSTILIFKKINNEDYYFPMSSDITYTSSEIDYQTIHLGSTQYIRISGMYDYFDGTYYYSYLVMYSNTFNVWDIQNDNTMYAILYDQSSVVINSGAPYTLNEFRISKNVTSLSTSGVSNITNISNLIIPNATSGSVNFSSYSLFSNCESYQLFDIANDLPSQEINSLNGLLYSKGYTTLLAVPKQIKVDPKYNRLQLSNNCLAISQYSFNYGTIDTVVESNIEVLVGSNVLEIADYSLAWTNIRSINFPILEKIGEFAFYQSKIHSLYLPSTLTSVGFQFVGECLYLEMLYLGNNFDCSLDLRGAEMINPINLGIQFYKLKPADKLGEHSITVQQIVYESIPQADLDYAYSINWEILPE